MKKNIALVAVLFGMVLSGAVFAQKPSDSAQHTVTVIVAPLNYIDVLADIDINLSATAIDDAFVSGSATTRLSWLTNETNRNISVSVGSLASGLTLQVTCAGITVDLSGEKLLRSVSQEADYCDLVYAASAPITTSPGTLDTVEVTYTLTGN